MGWGQGARAVFKAYFWNVLDPVTLSEGYSMGAFPMADDDGEVGWYTVRQRALFPVSGIHTSKSLAKLIRSGRFEVRFDTQFEAVMRGCFRPDGNWLTEEFVTAYSACHVQGWAHCGETWFDGELVGGVYGLAVGSCFCAESMFHRETGASKVALWALVERCRELGFTVFDAQIMNPHLASLGAFEVPNQDYMALLADALERSTPWSIGRP